jgi:hypothetical protein
VLFVLPTRGVVYVFHLHSCGNWALTGWTNFFFDNNLNPLNASRPHLLHQKFHIRITQTQAPMGSAKLFILPKVSAMDHQTPPTVTLRD